MPSFDLKCQNKDCGKIFTVTFQFSEFDDVERVKCPECGSETKRIWAQNGPQVFIPAQFGVTKKGFI